MTDAAAERNDALPGAVLARFDALPSGTSEGAFEGRRWRATKSLSEDGRRGWIWGEELGGTRRVSGNVFRLRAGAVLKPCEMPAEAVHAFLLGYEARD